MPTLVTLFLTRTVAQLVAEGRTISIDESFRWLVGYGYLFGIPNPFIIFSITALFSWFLLTRTTWGRDVYAIGRKEQTARLTDFRVGRLKTIVYVLSALLAGVAGLTESGYLGVAVPYTGYYRELYVIAASAIGGANLAGGKGTILGTIMGVIILSVLSNALILGGIAPIWQEVLLVAMLIFAVPIAYFRKLLGHH